MLRDLQSRDFVAIELGDPEVAGRVSCDGPGAALDCLHIREDTIGSNLYDLIDGWFREVQVAVGSRRNILRLGVRSGNRELGDDTAGGYPANDVFELVNETQVAIWASGDSNGIVRTSHRSKHTEVPCLIHAADLIGDAFAEPQRPIRSQ